MAAQIRDDAREATDFHLGADRESAVEIQREIDRRLTPCRRPSPGHANEPLTYQFVDERGYNLGRHPGHRSDLGTRGEPGTPQRVYDHAAQMTATIEGGQAGNAHARDRRVVRWTIGVRPAK
jgi:hypothetical protein